MTERESRYMPFRHNAVIDYPRKFTEYLLAFGDTPRGARRKGDDFLHFGITLEHMDWLMNVLLDIANTSEYVSKRKSRVGWNYAFYTLIPAPNGMQLPLISVWSLDDDSDIPHLSTAYPNPDGYEGIKLI